MIKYKNKTWSFKINKITNNTTKGMTKINKTRRMIRPNSNRYAASGTSFMYLDVSFALQI